MSNNITIDDMMSSNGNGVPHNMKKKRKEVAHRDQNKHWLDDDRLFFDPEELLFSTSDNLNAHGHTAEVLLLDEVKGGGRLHVTAPVPVPTARNDVVLALAAPYSRSAGSDASVNSYAVNAVGEVDDDHAMDIGLFEELWEVVYGAAGPPPANGTGEPKHD